MPEQPEAPAVVLGEFEWFKVLSFLSGPDIARCSQLNKFFRTLIDVNATALWKEALKDFRDVPDLQAMLEGSGAEASAWYRQCYEVAQFRKGRWISPKISAPEGPLVICAPPASEGHGLCSWRNRYLVYCGGWSEHGLTTQIHVLDCAALPAAAKWLRVRLDPQGTPPGTPVCK